jgi:hypothetical protein
MRRPIVENPRTSAWPWLLIAACLVLTSACDERPPTAPAPPSLVVEGRWTGTMADRSAGSGAVEIVLNGSSDVGTGTFSLTFPDASANLQGQVLARTKDAPVIDLSINLTTSARDCQGAPGLFYTARLTLNANRMTGTYEPSIGCPLLRGGSLELTRR